MIDFDLKDMRNSVLSNVISKPALEQVRYPVS